MNARNFDVVILGGGNAGMGVTIPTREAGLSVAMIESWDLGGTCPNRGCTPKKVLVAAAHALQEIGLAAVHHISVDKPRLDWPALIEREKAMIRDIPERLGKLMANRGAQVIKGNGRFSEPNRIQIGDETIEARHIVIATGSKTRPLSVPGSELMVTSDDVLSDQQRRSDIVFVGGGIIAFEFAHVYARAGVKVTILEIAPRLLANFESDAVDQIRAESERLGIVVLTNVTIKRIDRFKNRFRVDYQEGKSDASIETEWVVNGAGRMANIDQLDLKAGSVAHDGGRIALDEYLRSTSNHAVYVCGDAVWSSPQLSPIATYEGQIVGRNIVDGPRHKPEYSGIPSCLYTVPALASVGLTEESAKQKGLKVRVKISDISGWLSAKTYAEHLAWAKVVIDVASDQIVGAHLVGHAGEEIIHLFAFAMKHGITASQMRDTVYSFPTFSSDVKNML